MAFHWIRVSCICREDRDISSKAITELKTRLKAFQHAVEVAGHGAAVLKLVKVPTCTGTVTVVFSRGKVGGAACNRSQPTVYAYDACRCDPDTI